MALLLCCSLLLGTCCQATVVLQVTSGHAAAEQALGAGSQPTLSPVDTSSRAASLPESVSRSRGSRCSHQLRQPAPCTSIPPPATLAAAATRRRHPESNDLSNLLPP